MPHPAFLLFKHMFRLNTINKSRKAGFNFHKFCNLYFFFKLILAKLELFKVCMIDSFISHFTNSVTFTCDVYMSYIHEQHAFTDWFAVLMLHMWSLSFGCPQVKQLKFCGLVHWVWSPTGMERSRGWDLTQDFGIARIVRMCSWRRLFRLIPKTE